MKVLLLAWLSVSAALAGDYRFKLSSQSFFDDPARALTISRSCRKANGRFDCAAYRAWDKAGSARLAPTEREGGANPGAVLCGKLGGLVVIGEDEKGGEASFCRFSDGSLVDNGSLLSHARPGE